MDAELTDPLGRLSPLYDLGTELTIRPRGGGTGSNIKDSDIAETLANRPNLFGTSQEQVIDDAVKTARGIRAYHGSPHEFEKFDTSKIGTGEGAQAFGHGLYFAEAEPVAQSYRYIDARINPDIVQYKGKPIQWHYDQAYINKDKLDRANARGQIMSDANARAKFWEDMMVGRHPHQVINDAVANPEDWPELTRYAKNINFNDFSEIGVPGHMYQVSINAHPEHFLDWDKPLSQQSEHVQSILDKLGFQPPKPEFGWNGYNGSYGIRIGDATQSYGKTAYATFHDLGRNKGVQAKVLGQDIGTYANIDHAKNAALGELEARGISPEINGANIYGMIAKGRPDQFSPTNPEAARLLNEAGIKGVKYLDAGSRNQGEGTRNFVVFDPKDIEIMRRYARGGDVKHGYTVGGRVGYATLGAVQEDDDSDITDALRLAKTSAPTGDPSADAMQRVLLSGAVSPQPKPYDLGRQIQEGIQAAKDLYGSYKGNVTEANRSAADLQSLAVENMRSGSPGRMLLGAGQDILAPVAGVMAPLTGGLETTRQGVEYRLGAGPANAFEVASNILQGPEDIVNAARLAAKSAPTVAHAADIAPAIAMTMLPARKATETTIADVAKRDMPSNNANIITNPSARELIYDTEQSGPFYRVSPRQASKNPRIVGGDENKIWTPSPADVRRIAGDRGHPPYGTTIYDSATGKETLVMPSEGENMPLNVANEYVKTLGLPAISQPEMPVSSLAKQAAIGRVYSLAVEGSPQYKTEIFEAYKRMMPDVVKQANAKNYDELMEAAYRQMGKETSDQFDRLPLNYSFHRAGEGNYANSGQMVADVHGNNHLFVYQGGDKHDFLHNIDPKTGLNENEKFRAVHDAFGHALLGNTFGAQGEERAWGLHSQMYSPLARLAMTSETRGQNSFVNYTPANVQIYENLFKLDEQIKIAKKYGTKEDVQKLKDQRKSLLDNDWQYAPNKAVLMPPEFLSTSYTGEMPNYIKPLIQPKEGTQFETPLTHYSMSPNLSRTDPAMYGTNTRVRGEEKNRLDPDVRDRTYFYLGEPGSQKNIEGDLGPYRYGAYGKNIYNVSEDPENLARLAAILNTPSPLATMNPGAFQKDLYANDLDRLIKMYGYSGRANTTGSYPQATIFDPVSVSRRADGGRANYATNGAVEYESIELPQSLKELQDWVKTHPAQLTRNSMDNVFTNRISALEGEKPIAMPANLRELQDWDRISHDHALNLARKLYDSED